MTRRVGWVWGLHVAMAYQDVGRIGADCIAMVLFVVLRMGLILLCATDLQRCIINYLIFTETKSEHFQNGRGFGI